MQRTDPAPERRQSGIGINNDVRQTETQSRTNIGGLIMPWPRWVLAGLLAMILIHPSAAQDVLTGEQKSAIEALIHNYYLSHPEAFIEALKNAQSFSRASAGNATNTVTPAAIAARRNDLVGDPRTPSIGNAGGDVTIVEFFDYRCPFCKRVHP